MTNWDRHKDEILKGMATSNKGLTCIVAKTRGQDCLTSTISCEDCYKLNAEWLDEKHEEPMVDWSKVKQGTEVYSKVVGDYVGDFVAEYGDFIILSFGNKLVTESLYTKNNYKIREDSND